MIDQSFKINAKFISEIKTLLKLGNDLSWQMIGWLWCPVVMSISSMAQRAPRPPGFLLNGEYEIPDLCHETLAQALSLPFQSLDRKNVTTWLIIVIKELCILDWLLFLSFLHLFTLCYRVDGVEEVQFEMSKIKQKSESLCRYVYQTEQRDIVNNLI